MSTTHIITLAEETRPSLSLLMRMLSDVQEMLNPATPYPRKVSLYRTWKLYLCIVKPGICAQQKVSEERVDEEKIEIVSRELLRIINDNIMVKR